MKKQILVMLLAFIASVSVAYGQAVSGSAPQPLTCTTGPLAPIAGVPYEYSANINPANGTAFWYATTATTFMQAGSRVNGIALPSGGAVVASGLNYMVNTPGATSPTKTTITWTTAGLAAVTPTNPLFVNIEYTAAAADCANNLKVFRIIPKNAFIVDIMNWDAANTAAAGYGNQVSQCVSDIESAAYNMVSSQMEYDFGTNIMYFEVIAANFTGSYNAQFRLSGLVANQTGTLEWGYVKGTYPTSAGTFNGNGSVINIPDQTVTTNELNTSNGVSIYVRLTVKHYDFESLAANNISLAVNGELPTTPALFSVDNTNCDNPSNFNDIAAQVLRPRPTVTPVAPLNFVPQRTP